MTSQELKFVATPISEDDIGNEIRGSRVYDKSTKRTMIEIFQEQCRLAVLLTGIVALVSAPNKLSSSSVTNDELSAIWNTISSTKDALTDWMAFSRLPARLKEKPNAGVKRMIKITLMYYQYVMTLPLP